jgi:phosphoribosylformylglycinamidine synthase
MIGFTDSLSNSMPSQFQNEGDCVGVLGNLGGDELYQSQFASYFLNRQDLQCPPLDLQCEKSLQELLLSLSSNHLLSSAHDSSDGGLVTALWESTNLNLDLSVAFEVPEGLSPGLFLYGEFASRAVISYSKQKTHEIQKTCESMNVPLTQVGTVRKGRFQCKGFFDVLSSAMYDKSRVFFEEL